MLTTLLIFQIIRGLKMPLHSFFKPPLQACTAKASTTNQSLIVPDFTDDAIAPSVQAVFQQPVISDKREKV